MVVEEVATSTALIATLAIIAIREIMVLYRGMSKNGPVDKIADAMQKNSELLIRMSERIEAQSRELERSHMSVVRHLDELRRGRSG